MSRISLDRGRHSIDDVGSVSSSSSLPDTDGHNGRISGSATPRSAHSTNSLEEVNAGPTRQYSIRRENGGPVIQQRPPSPGSSTSDGSSQPPRRDRPPPVQERTSSLTPTLSRRTSQPLRKIYLCQNMLLKNFSQSVYQMVMSPCAQHEKLTPNTPEHSLEGRSRLNIRHPRLRLFHLPR